ncbi:MAG: biopolymer transporter ExbD [Candidatus Eisenbacteria bacterium]|uniref:Biopolymer transporter ExbD n=1 Tax=Eiseniibacteriota bacterium TaxID=2212470 RepID=A0A948RY69_UNCEI|nr:biopolymer transporter ExbD [Candidatus Eisenbacteria bacterium]MBU1949336.1 biopolymer transporter ExbD [Candidatus Eisenbacteria bacterium]MBU2690409.1 biopolymer transporter ExbD [Candidatus Eisenbacteria bacterium]
MSAISFRIGKERKQITLNVTPLIDVLFLLIIFFAVTGTFKRVGELELQLPRSTTSTPALEGELAHEVEVIMTESGRLILDGEETPMPQLKGRLLEILAADPQSRVMIKAEAGVRHGEVVWILDIVRDTGFPGVGIGTQIGPPPPENRP